MKKFFALCSITAAALLLSGCSGRWIPEYHGFGNFPDLSDGAGENVHGTSSGSGDNTSLSGTSSGYGSNTSVPGRELRHVTISLDNDPDNKRVLTIDNELLTVEITNGDWVTDSVRIGTIAFAAEKDGDKTRFTLDGTRMRNGYVNLELWSGREIFTYRLKHDGKGFSFPNVMDICEENAAAAGSPNVLTYNQTLRYITKDGTSANAETVLKQIESLSNRICRGMHSDYEKLRAISRWVSENIYYDHVAYKDGIPDECLTLEYMLERGSSVCGGYAAMTSALCEAQGIKCLHITGSAITQNNCFAEANNGVHHEWNYAIIGGRGIWVDSGWNSNSNLYEAGSYSQEKISYKYFDIGPEVFALNHKADYAQLRNYFPED